MLDEAVEAEQVSPVVIPSQLNTNTNGDSNSADVSGDTTNDESKILDPTEDMG